MKLDSSIGVARMCGWLFMTAALAALSCGGEDNSGDDDDDDVTATATTGTNASTTGGGGNPANCPSTNPGNSQSCDGFTPGLACSYNGVTCTCSGITWNCASGSASGGNPGPSNGGQFDSSGSNATNTSGNGFGGGDDGSNDTVGSATTGFNTDCEGVTPEHGEACETSGTICGLEEGSDEICACFALGSDEPTWTCASGDIGGFGGAGGD